MPADFAQLGSRDLVDKTLQRLVASGKLRRIDRGLYDMPSINRLTNRPSVPDYRAVVEAVARRDQIRVLVDGITAANDLGLQLVDTTHQHQFGFVYSTRHVIRAGAAYAYQPRLAGHR
ncbi:DUF6088 family protein [Paraburkholderia franconis]|uniref:DUF6088 family protein n=1 Tax=Paraburkholderia franconis TaxID=2654983 RepID=UPI002AB1B095|nr:DUF6088 family protein [Paraburkholderia franconis]